MVTKRKASAASQPNKQQKKQEQIESQTPIAVEEKKPEIEPKPEQIEQKIEEQVEEEVEEEEEEEVEEEEVDEEVEEEEEQEQEEEHEHEQEVDEDEEPIETLIEPFTKEQLTSLLREAAEKHADVASRVRNLADKDIVHRKIFVHGLGWDTTTETLRETFAKYGEIEDCKAVTDKVTGKSKGYGFILFKTRVGAKKALKEPQKTVSGRTASCQLAAVGPVGGGATSSGVATAAGGGGGGGGFQTEYTQRKIYVSNVSADLEPSKLSAYFAKFGEIEDGPLGIDKSTGKFKGFCLFVYKTVESARKALEEPHKQYEGHTLHCQRAIDGPKPGKSGHGHVGHSHGHGHHHSGGGHGRRGDNPGFLGSGPNVSVGVGPSGVGGGAGFNPALGQALTALLASQGAGLGLNNILGTLGGAGGAGHMGQGGGVGGGYGAAAGMGMGIGPGGVGGLGGYGNQVGYPNQMGQGGGRSQHGYNGAPYGGH